MKKLSLISAFVIVLILVVGSSAPAEEESFTLKGLELAKGIDIGRIRIGTVFAGEVLDRSTEEEIGYWTVCIKHRGAQNIEICGGRNDIVSLRVAQFK